MLRLRKKAALAAVSVAAIGGVFLSTPASAAELGTVKVTGTNYEQSRSWGAGWDQCRATYPKTKSIKRLSNESGGTTSTGRRWATTWACYDTATN